MRILIVTHYYPGHGGGIEIVAGELATRLQARGVDIRWAASDLHDEANGIKSRVAMTAWNGLERRLGIPYPVWSPASFAQLNREVSQCDLVHLHDVLYAGNLAAAFLALKRRRPLLVTQHIGPVPYRNRVLRLLMRAGTAIFTKRVLAACDQAVFISQSVMGHFERLTYRRAPLFIPNGLDQACFRPPTESRRAEVRRPLGLDSGRPVVLFVGRFVEMKGLAVVRALAKRFADYSWIVVGHGPIDPRAWGLANVRCVGLVPHHQIANYYQAADLLILPSFSEGFPLVVQEAMACGTPALITPDTARAIPGVANVTLQASPTMDDMARALTTAFSAPERLRTMAEEAARFARRHFDWDACADQYLEIIRKLTSSQHMKRDH